jgi:hypothetical protein
MIYKIELEKNSLLYGIYDISKPYPKNTPIKKDVNKRLFHLTKHIIERTNMNIECAVCSIFSH